jgi:dTDP-4-amino-4,6-dideoxygalactose transaminase
MLLRQNGNGPLPYPFQIPDISYFYLARNAIYALARYWNLADQEVLFPSYFHGVELEALLAAGVKPKFYPIHRGMRAEFQEIIDRVSPKTRAVYLIHYLGFAGPVRELVDFCRANRLLLIEDCALALLSSLGSTPLGSFGDASVFCLYKTLPVPDGGALCLREGECADFGRGRAPSITSTVAHSFSGWSRGHVHAHQALEAIRTVKDGSHSVPGVVAIGSRHFDQRHADIRMSQISRWIIAAQDFDSIVRIRRRNYLHLHHRLAQACSPVFKQLPDGVCPLFYPIETRDKPRFLADLSARGIEAVNFWSRSHDLVPPGVFPETDEMRRTVVELPCHQDLTLDAMDWITNEVLAASEM